MSVTILGTNINTGTLGAGDVGVVPYGTDPDTIRPNKDIVFWFLTVEPNNMVDDDVWFDMS